MQAAIERAGGRSICSSEYCKTTPDGFRVIERMDVICKHDTKLPGAVWDEASAAQHDLLTLPKPRGKLY